MCHPSRIITSTKAEELFNTGATVLLIIDVGFIAGIPGTATRRIRRHGVPKVTGTRLFYWTIVQEKKRLRAKGFTPIGHSFALPEETKVAA